MKSLLNKIEKNDIKFYAALAFFAMCCVCRFLGPMIIKDNITFGLIENKTKSTCIMCIYFFMFFVFYILCTLLHENKKKMYYLASFLSVFAFPMFTSTAYFGSREVYAWAITLASVVLIVFQNAEWLSVPLMMLALWLYPSAAFSCLLCISILLLCQYKTKNNKKYIGVLLLNIIGGIVVFFIQATTKGVNVNADGSISLKKFIVLVILMLPYILIGFDFFKGLLKKSKVYILMLLAVIPMFGYDLLTRDYSRAFFHVFVYFTIVIMAQIALKDKAIIQQVESIEEKITDYVSIPSVLIIYPFIFMTLWISGFVVLPAEIFVG